jgi:hypothetical protein
MPMPLAIGMKMHQWPTVRYPLLVRVSLQESTMFKQKQARACSFCGKEQDSRRRLIAGPGVAICNECVGLCTEILGQEGSLEPSPLELGRAEHELADLPSEVLLEGLHRRSAGIHREQRELQQVVSTLRERGTTWAKIGEALGVSRQSAWERYSGED